MHPHTLHGHVIVYQILFRSIVVVSIVMGVPPIAGWFMMENPNLKWMISRGTPMTQETTIVLSVPLSERVRMCSQCQEELGTTSWASWDTDTELTATWPVRKLRKGSSLGCSMMIQC